MRRTVQLGIAHVPEPCTSVFTRRCSPRLIAVCARLNEEAYRDRRLMMATLSDPGEFVKNHEVLADAAIERATLRAEVMVEQHITPIGVDVEYDRQPRLLKLQFRRMGQIPHLSNFARSWPIAYPAWPGVWPCSGSALIPGTMSAAPENVSTLPA